MYPVKRNGRAHFLASVKRLGILISSTLLFNIIAIWIMSMVLYFLLRYSVLRKTLSFLGRFAAKELDSVAIIKFICIKLYD